MAQSIYEFLLAQGAPPEAIARIMEQMKRPVNKFSNQNVGFRGIPAGMNSTAVRPAYPNPPLR